MNPEHLIAQNVREFIAIRHREAKNNDRKNESTRDRLASSDGDGEGLVPYPPCLTFAEEVDVDDQTPNKSMTPAAAQVATLTSLPFASTVKNGLVAIIDIVGYTRLTNFLDEYSGSGGALVRDLLNKPFTKIIERIHAHSGSIVKFAGDAVIVSWSPPYNTETTENNALLLCSKAVLCCIELLFLFRNYKINLPQSEEFQKLSAALEQQDQDDTTGNNYQSGFDSTGRNDAAYVQHRKYVTSRQIMSANSPASNRHGGAGSANRGGERPKTKARSLPLRIHIGLAFGEVSHVYLGELYASTSLSSLNQGRLLESKNHQHLSPIPSSQEQHASLQNEAQTARTEYVIAGEAVETAGKLLGLGKEGELMICAGTMQHINNMIMSYSEPGKKGAGSRFDLMNIIDKRGDAFLVSAATMMDEEKAKTLSNTLKKTKIPEDSKGSGEAFLNPNWNSELLHLSLAYLDESLAKFVQQHQSNFGWGGLSMGSTFAINASPTNNQGSKSSAQRGKGKFVRLAVGDNPLGGDKAQSSQLNPIANTTANVSMIGLAPYGINIDDASDYNQIRRVTIVFLRLTSFRVRDAASPSLLHIAQSVMIAALSSIRMFGGCLRQFNFDDKAATVLMVWGLEGFAHERGEAFYAISAALSLSKKMEAIVGNEFSIGVCTGKVFSGMIGNSERADGTVLGVCVNLAARIMCDPLCQGRILCDDTTYKESKDEIEFANERYQLQVKGSDYPISAHVPTKKRAGHVKEDNSSSETENIYGRDAELLMMRRILQDHINGRETVHLLISGATGTGKTLFVDSFKKQAQDQELFVCHTRGSENFRYLMYFGFFQILVDLFRHIHPRLSEIRAHRARSSSRKGSEIQRLSVVDLSANNSIANISINRSMSGLALNNQSFEEPAAMDVEEILKVLGESSSSVLMLDSLFPMLRGVRDVGNLQNGDIGARFPRFMVKLLNAVTSIDYKVALILEDIQWMDAKTFILIKEIMKSCPNVLVLLLSRPIEEYPKELDELYQSIVQADRLEQIVLKQFDRQGTEALLRGYLGPKLKSLQQISPELVRDIYERSQGVPFAVKVLASSILQNSDTAMREIPKDALTAIVAQFDRLPIEAKAVLRVAAVAGQTFSLVDVYEVLKRGSFGVANNFNSSDDIRITLTKSDPYHFVTKSSMFNSVTMSFSHYLIQQGILSTIIPKRKEIIHRLFADYYEDTLEPSNAKTQLPLLVRQLLELPNEKYRKLKYTQIAFQEAAEQCMPVEGFMYYKIFQDLVAQYGQYLELTPIQRARHYKLLGLLHFESGNFAQASENIKKAIKELGLNFPGPSQNLRFLTLAFDAIRIQYKLFKLPLEEQTTLSRSWAVKITPYAFKNLNICDMRPATKNYYCNKGTEILPLSGSKEEDFPSMPVDVAPEDSDDDDEAEGFATHDVRRREPKVVSIVDTFTFNDAAKDVFHIFDVAVRVFYNDRPGRELLLVALIGLNICPSIVPVPKENIGKGLGRVACSCLALGMTKTGEKYVRRAMEVTEEIENNKTALDIAGMLSLAISYEFQALAELFHFKTLNYMRLLTVTVNILDSIGYGDAEFTYIHRLSIISAGVWSEGELRQVIPALEAEYRKKMGMERNMFCMKELELHLAGIYGMKGQAKEMIDFYNMACSRLARGDNATGGIWRKTRSHIFSLHVEVMMIIKSASLDPDGETEMWRSKATESLHYLADKISRITTIMILAIYPAMHILIPILCDWIIFRLQSMLRHSQSRKSPSRLHTDMEEAKALRCIFSTCQKCWKRAPKSTIPTYPSLLVMLKGLRYLLDGKIAQFSHQILKGIKLIDATPALTKTFKSRLHARILRANAIETMASVRSRDGRVVDVNTISPTSGTVKKTRTAKVHPGIASSMLQDALQYFEEKGFLWEVEHLETCVKLCGTREPC